MNAGAGGRCRRWLAAVALAPGIASALAAQEAAAFDTAWRAFAAATEAGLRQQAARQTSDLFLTLPAGDERSARLAAGIEATLAADRAALAVDLAREARQAGDTGPRIVRAHLLALVDLRDLAGFVHLATSDRIHQPAAVDAAFVAAEGRLLPLADAATRVGDPNGRFVFEHLAALEPADAGRLANLALLMRHLGEVDRARALYERSRALAPGDPTLESDFGLFLRATGDAAGAAAAFRRSLELDATLPGGRRGLGPGVTNLMHGEARQPGSSEPDPVPDASAALALRPEAAMLRRLLLDVVLDRLVARTAAGAVVRTDPPR